MFFFHICISLLILKLIEYHYSSFISNVLALVGNLLEIVLPAELVISFSYQLFPPIPCKSPIPAPEATIEGIPEKCLTRSNQPYIVKI